MPLEGPDRLYLRAAAGYIEFGMFDEANAKLEKIEPILPAFARNAANACRHLSRLRKWHLLAGGREKIDRMESERARLFR